MLEMLGVAGEIVIVPFLVVLAQFVLEPLGLVVKFLGLIMESGSFEVLGGLAEMVDPALGVPGFAAVIAVLEFLDVAADFVSLSLLTFFNRFAEGVVQFTHFSVSVKTMEAFRFFGVFAQHLVEFLLEFVGLLALAFPGEVFDPLPQFLDLADELSDFFIIIPLLPAVILVVVPVVTLAIVIASFASGAAFALAVFSIIVAPFAGFGAFTIVATFSSVFFASFLALVVVIRNG